MASYKAILDPRRWVPTASTETDYPPFDAWTAFTPTLSASSGTWTLGTVNTAKYKVFGKTMFVTVDVYGTSVSATPIALLVAIPGGHTAAAGNTGQTASVSDNGVAKAAWALAASGQINVLQDVGGAGLWATSVANTRVGFTITFEIV